MSGDDDLTPEEAELWARWQAAAAAPKQSHVTPFNPVFESEDPERRPLRHPRRHDLASWEGAAALLVLCRNRGRGRPARVAVVVAGPSDRGRGVVVTADPDTGLNLRYPSGDQPGGFGAPLGADVAIDCRCGITHVIDGAALRAAVLASAPRRGKVPTVDVAEVERRA